MKHPATALGLTAVLLAFSPATLCAQTAAEDAVHNIDVDVQAEVSSSKNATPLWLTANKHGLSSVEAQNGYLRASVGHSSDADSLRKWRIGYKADVAVPYNYTSHFVVQQLYADFNYQLLRLSVGAREYGSELKDDELSTGGQTFSANARPVPSVRIELPKWWNISGRGRWAFIRGHFSYGMFTDGAFQQEQTNNGQTSHYAKNVLLHTKALYVKFGKPERFPLVFEGGFEWATQFGGTSYGAQTWDGVSSEPVKMGHSVKDFFHAIYGGGGDSTDGDGYANASGNTLGSWLARLTWQAKDWSLSLYYDHYFEDHSQLFGQYGWKDGVFGVEAVLPKNHFVDKVAYEYINTTDQSGSVYHDRTDAIPDQISGRDNYYYHNLYAGWEHWGQAMGNPLFTSLLYTPESGLTFMSTRFKAHHIGLSGSPSNEWHYRILYTHQHSLGTYYAPYDRPKNSNSVLLQATYAPVRIRKSDGWSFRASFAMDRGSILGNNAGFALTVAKHWNVAKKKNKS